LVIQRDIDVFSVVKVLVHDLVKFSHRVIVLCGELVVFGGHIFADVKDQVCIKI